MSLTGLLFLLSFTAGCALSLGRHPVFGLATYVAVFYLHPPSRWWGYDLPGVRWALVAAAVTLISVWVHDKKLPTRGSFFGFAPVWLLVVIIIWMAIQLFWAVWPDRQLEILVLYTKYLVLMFVIYRILQSEREIKLFLWAHVLGCFFLGWTAYESHTGGRFEDFGGSDIGEANAGALTLATGAFAVGVLFLISSWRERIPLVLMSPFILDGIIRTVSRSAFLALAAGGLTFNALTPATYRRFVRWLSVLAAVLFLILTNPFYWTRIDTVKALGEDVEGSDTGAGRLVIMAAQLEMFKINPLGSGHRATAYYSPLYLDDRYLTGIGEDRMRSSHNTFLSFLVEHGVIGGFFYVVLLLWILRQLRHLKRRLNGTSGFGATLLPGVAAVLTSIYVGDLFVDYLKFEVRFWFLAILMVMVRIWIRNQTAVPVVARPDELPPEETSPLSLGRSAMSPSAPDSPKTYSPRLTGVPPSGRAHDTEWGHRL